MLDRLFKTGTFRIPREGVDIPQILRTIDRIEREMKVLISKIAGAVADSTRWVKTEANGATPTGFTAVAQVVADLQDNNDGATYTCTEVVGGNNNLVVDFADVVAFNLVRILAYYNTNAATHNILLQVEITPFDGSAWHTFDAIEPQGAAANVMQDHSFIIPSDVAYINSGVVKVRFLHSAATVNNHVLDIDECSLYQYGVHSAERS